MPSSQLQLILHDLERHRHIFDLDQNDLGANALDIACEVMLRDMDDEIDPDGVPWPALSPAYARWKTRWFSGNPMAVLYGQMKTMLQLQGERRITATEAVMVYGVTDEARNEAVWFQEDHIRTTQPARPFYALSIETITRLDSYFEAHLQRV